MPHINGRDFSRDELLQRIGRVDQLGGITPVTLHDGRSAGVQALNVVTGSGMAFTVLSDRCLDIAHLRFNGHSLTWLSRNGVVGPQFYEPEGNGFLRSFTGGLVTTCGLRNFGPPCQVDDTWFSMHGRIGNLPAEEVTWGTTWDGDECDLWIEGVVRETRVFGENLTLRRRITARLGSSMLRIENVVRNEGWQPEGHMILFHMNMGFPLLDAGTHLRVDTTKVTPRDAEAERGRDEFDRFIAPQPDFHEQVFIMELQPDAQGMTTATFVNPTLDDGLGLRLRFSKEQLPWMMLWRQMGQGTYVVGLEPANCPTIEGRAEATRRGTLPFLQPGEERRYDIEVSVLTGNDV